MSELRDRLQSTLYSAVSAAFQKPVEQISDATSFAELGARSLNYSQIISALEDELEIEIPFSEFRRKKTVGEAIDYVAALCGSQPVS